MKYKIAMYSKPSEPTLGASPDLQITSMYVSTQGLINTRLNPTPEISKYSIKLGWIQGVLIPCLLNIWGVMLFLRISWIVGQAGILLTTAIIMLSGVVCVITTLSLSAICTNGKVYGGGVYYLVSRSLGAELGASVGIIFALANAVAASMNTIGFCESLNSVLKAHQLKIIDNDVNDIRIIGPIALIIMCLICAVGMDVETKAQNFLITIIVLAMANFIVGTSIGPGSDKARAQGFVGINENTATKNWGPDFRYAEGEQHNFISIFAIYFPAVTGIQAGANICGDLKNAETAIPKGTLTAMTVSVASYSIIASLCGVAALRDASGNATNISPDVLAACKPDCPYGLHNNYEIMHLMALWGPLIYGGCWAATLSTALTNLLSIPRLIQALGRDRIFPGLIFFSKGYGRHGEPYRGYVLAFMVSALFLLIADLNTIAPLITNFYLASYALINICCFHGSHVRHISWRPSFQYHNKWLALLGFMMCMAIMIIISWVMALITVIFFWVLYFLVLYRKPKVDWGSSSEAQRYTTTVSLLLDMTRRRRDAIKSYNPQLLVLSAQPHLRPALLDIGHLITKPGSFMIVAELEVMNLTHDEREARLLVAEQWLYSKKYRGFYVLQDGFSFEDGVRGILQTVGLGPLSPNILMMGYKHNMTKISHDEIREYVNLIQLAFDRHLAVTILRTVDVSQPLRRVSVSSIQNREVHDTRTRSPVTSVMNSDSNTEIIDHVISEPKTDENDLTDQHVNNETITDDQKVSTNKNSRDQNLKKPKTAHFSKTERPAYLKPITFSQGSFVDAWWLYDDGGLNILLPYIITQYGFKEAMQLRVFALGKGNPAESKKQMEELLKMFRIEYSSLMMLQGLNDPPEETTQVLFNSIIKKFMATTEEHNDNDVLITQAILRAKAYKTNRYMRLREMLLEYSSEASLIIMTLPIPRMDLESKALYMAWLEVMSTDQPPMLFVRGNNTCVLAT